MLRYALHDGLNDALLIHQSIFVPTTRRTFPCPRRFSAYMRATIAFFLGILMLLGSFVPENDLGELAKLPELAKHYEYHHSAAGGGLNFGQFIAEHYGAGTKHYAGCSLSPRHQQDHHNLPLRCHHGCVTLSFVIAPLMRLHFSSQPAPTEVRTYRVAAAPRYAFSFSAALGQPPRA
jgi:hypothetical protein